LKEQHIIKALEDRELRNTFRHKREEVIGE
jgi:hypothetical protein